MRKSRKPDFKRSGGAPSHGSRPHGGRDSRSGRPGPRDSAGAPRGRAVAGIHAVSELLKVRPRSVSALWMRDNHQGHPELAKIAEIAAQARVKVTPHGTAALDRFTTANQGVIAFSDEAPELDLNAIKKLPRASLIVLDEVEDPHNLGAVLRTAWLFGVQGVLTPETRSASLTATVSKVAQGAVEHVPVMQESGLLETLKQLKSDGFWLFGLSHKGESSLYQTEIPDKVIWVLGSESSGIRKPIERECDQLISIPQAEPEASFNVSVAAAIAMGETFRQRSAAPV